jgi:hypothetical protein
MKIILTLITLLTIASCTKETTLDPIDDNEPEAIEQKVIKNYKLTFLSAHSEKYGSAGAGAWYSVIIKDSNGAIKYQSNGYVIRKNITITKEAITGDKVEFILKVNTSLCEGILVCYTNTTNYYFGLYNDNKYITESTTRSMQ